MGLRSSWCAVAGLVAFSALACSGNVSNGDDFSRDGGGGKLSSAGGGAGGRPSFSGGGVSASGPGGAKHSSAGYPEYPGGEGGWISATGGTFEAGSGGTYDLPPEPCDVGFCAGSPGEFAGAGGSADNTPPGPDLTPGECNRGNGCLVAQGNEVRALTADLSDVYWVEHGTFDDLD